VQYELRTQVIEPPRKTFTHLVERYGDRPASRYEEGSIGIQPKENFHYRPLWDPAHDIYDEAFSAFRLTDPYSFTDPRQYYYAPYVTSRAAMADAVASTLDYLDKRDLLSRMPDAWSALMGELLVPLRHYESGAQMVSCDIARFGFGTTITQCAAYAAFDRIGNAQAVSRIGIALDGGTAALLGEAKTRWVEDASLQGLRRYMEELFLEKDWGKALIRLDVLDRLIYGLFFGHLDDAAIDAGAGSYSLLRPAPGVVVHRPAQVGRRPVQGMGGRPRDGRCEQGAPRGQHDRGARSRTGSHRPARCPCRRARRRRCSRPRRGHRHHRP
jgi:phenol hydroxylase P1 protein